MIDRVKGLATETVSTPIERHLAEEYVILAERVRRIAELTTKTIREGKTDDNKHSNLIYRLHSIEYLANSAFYRDWDR